VVSLFSAFALFSFCSYWDRFFSTHFSSASCTTANCFYARCMWYLFGICQMFARNRLSSKHSSATTQFLSNPRTWSLSALSSRRQHQALCIMLWPFLWFAWLQIFMFGRALGGPWPTTNRWEEVYFNKCYNRCWGTAWQCATRNDACGNKQEQSMLILQQAHNRQIVLTTNPLDLFLSQIHKHLKVSKSLHVDNFVKWCTVSTYVTRILHSL